MAQYFEFGLDTFGDITTGPDGRLLSHAQVIRHVVEEAVLADELGVDALTSASITGPTSPCLRRKSCLLRSPDEPNAFISARR
jgi:hypothetical protein